MIRTLWATAALMAIFAMHGLATHAGPADPSPLPAAGTSHVGHAATGVDDSSLASPAPSHGEQGHEMTALGLCAAVLATSAVLLLVGFGRPRSGVLGLVPRAVTTTTYPTGVRVEHAPPDLHALSILRC